MNDFNPFVVILIKKPFVKQQALIHLDMKKILLLLLVSIFALGTINAKDVEVLQDTQYEKLIKKAKKPYVIDFSATRCMPCKKFAPTYHEVANEMGSKIDFYTVDIDKAPVLSKEFKVRVVPTIVIVNPKSGKTQRFEGVQTKEDFVSALKSVL